MIQIFFKLNKAGVFNAIALAVTLMLSGCDAEEPVKEDIPELITRVTLTFTPDNGGAPVTVTASDPDGEGVKDIMVDGAINLTTGTSYTLTLSLINELAEKSSPAYDITNEVEEEGAEHMFFFGWTENIFLDPAGNGNIDQRADAVNYTDLDDAGLPIGIITQWKAGTPMEGTFRLVLKHQPGLKSATSPIDIGETDLDVEFEIKVN